MGPVHLDRPFLLEANVRAGRLYRRVTVQRKTITQDEFGQEIETWSALSHNRPAGYRPLSGDERFTADQFVARQQVEFRLRYSTVIADLNPLDRILYPTPSDEDVQSPDASDIYEIMGVSEIGRREGLLVKTARRSEQ